MGLWRLYSLLFQMFAVDVSGDFFDDGLDFGILLEATDNEPIASFGIAGFQQVDYCL